MKLKSCDLMKLVEKIDAWDARGMCDQTIDRPAASG